jgi:hypothetical protein
MLASNKRENAGLNAGSPENWFHLESRSFKRDSWICVAIEETRKRDDDAHDVWLFGA